MRKDERRGAHQIQKSVRPSPRLVPRECAHARLHAGDRLSPDATVRTFETSTSYHRAPVACKMSPFVEVAFELEAASVASGRLKSQRRCGGVVVREAKHGVG